VSYSGSTYVCILASTGNLPTNTTYFSSLAQKGSDGAGSGTVTSESFTGGLISVANPTTTPALTVAGTSGGIPYFSSASTWASSGALAANGVMLGGGVGSAPTVTAADTTATHALFAAVSGAPAFRAMTTADLPAANITRTVAIIDLAPVVGDSGLILVINPPTAIHLTRVFCAVQGTTNVVLNLDKRTEAALGTPVASLLGSDLTAVAGGANTSTWASSPCGGTSSCAIAAHAPVVMTFTSVSGTPTALNCSLDFTVD
jgi:hypothetical protein